jgi:DtxR family transcriptional regulator, manganese transport regulator
MPANARANRAKPPARLPAELTQARRFGKARSARSNALREDYVELVADLLATVGEARPTDIAKRLGVSHVSAIRTIARLKRDGLMVGRPYRGIFLTKAGKALAEQVRLRHRIVVDLLLAVGAPTEAAEADAEGMEHHVSDATLKAFGQYLQVREKQCKKPAVRCGQTMTSQPQLRRAVTVMRSRDSVGQRVVDEPAVATICGRDGSR